MQRCLLLLLLPCVWLGACQKAAPPAGFLSSYDQLEQTAPNRLRFVVEPERLSGYTRFIVEPTEVLVEAEETRVSSDDIQALASDWHASLVQRLGERFEVVTAPGPGTARLRTAVTDLRKSTWWLSLHPATKLSGAGAGAAAIEAELVDSQTGEQLLASVETRRGNPVELDTFNPIDDAEDALRAWADWFMQSLDASE